MKNQDSPFSSKKVLDLPWDSHFGSSWSVLWSRSDLMVTILKENPQVWWFDIKESTKKSYLIGWICFFLLGWGEGKWESGHRIERTQVDWLFLLKMFGCWEVEGVSLNTDCILHIHPCDIGEPLMIIMLTEMMTTTCDRRISMLRTLIYVCVDRSSLLPCESRLSFGAYHVFLVVWTPTIVFYPVLENPPIACWNLWIWNAMGNEPTIEDAEHVWTWTCDPVIHNYIFALLI